MTQPRPTAAELLAAVREFLEEDADLQPGKPHAEWRS